MTNTEEKLISINAALAARAELLAQVESGYLPPVAFGALTLEFARGAYKAQIRDLETEKHALLQELPL